jgi:hypothetical protein
VAASAPWFAAVSLPNGISVLGEGTSDCLVLGFAGPYVGANGEFIYPFAEHWNGTSLKLMP